MSFSTTVRRLSLATRSSSGLRQDPRLFAGGEAYNLHHVVLFTSLPDLRDGLKPLHRLIICSMHRLGFSSKRRFNRSCRVVADVAGRCQLSETAVFHGLVRMAQDFSLRYPLILGRGPLGSIDGGLPITMRYTKCKLQGLTEAVFLADLEQDKQSSVLPARLPTLLLNGSSGSEVGIPSKIPPHNLGELVDALCALIQNPEATLPQLMEHMPGPDFPTGGLIMGNLGILEAYRTGRGCVIVRGKTDIELLDSKTKQAAIVIKEIPYQTLRGSLVRRIANLVRDKSLDGISVIRDESNGSGLRIVIVGADPSVVLTNLYESTSLQSVFDYRLVCIVNGRPEQMGLKELLRAFLDFRCSVIERCAKWKISEAEERRHIAEGFVAGIDNFSGVHDILQKSSSNAAKCAALRKEVNLSERQARAIVQDRGTIYRRRERNGYVDEIKSLTEQISKQKELLSSRDNILRLIEQEAVELKRHFSDPRRTVLAASDGGQP